MGRDEQVNLALDVFPARISPAVGIVVRRQTSSIESRRAAVLAVLVFLHCVVL